MSQGTDMDAQDAADIMRQAQEHARGELTVNRLLLLGRAGLFYLRAYGTVWLTVRGHGRPHRRVRSHPGNGTGHRRRRPCHVAAVRLRPRHLADRRGSRQRVRGPGDGVGNRRAGGLRRVAVRSGHLVPARPVMSTGGLDPVIHAPARLRLMVTLAALPEGDDLSFTRLQDIIGLTPGHPVTHLRELADAGYVRTEQASPARTTVVLTHDGRGALDRYSAVVRQRPAGAARKDHSDIRIGDADRDAAAAALGEHFAQGRLTLDELGERLEAVFTATTHREIARATWDLPEVTVPRRGRL